MRKADIEVQILTELSKAKVAFVIDVDGIIYYTTDEDREKGDKIIEQIEEQAKMKKWSCNVCGKEIEVEESYEPEMCCSGLREACGCMGQPTKKYWIEDIYGIDIDNL